MIINRNYLNCNYNLLPKLPFSSLTINDDDDKHNLITITINTMLEKQKEEIFFFSQLAQG